MKISLDLAVKLSQLQKATNRKSKSELTIQSSSKLLLKATMPQALDIAMPICLELQSATPSLADPTAADTSNQAKARTK